MTLLWWSLKRRAIKWNRRPQAEKISDFWPNWRGFRLKKRFLLLFKKKRPHLSSSGNRELFRISWKNRGKRGNRGPRRTREYLIPFVVYSVQLSRTFHVKDDFPKRNSDRKSMTHREKQNLCFIATFAKRRVLSALSGSWKTISSGLSLHSLLQMFAQSNLMTDLTRRIGNSKLPKAFI